MPEYESSTVAERRSGVIRVLIADDDPIVQSSLAGYVRCSPALELVGAVCNGREAVTRACPAVVDVVLMDVQMPILDGISATQEITTSSPAIKVLVLTAFDEERFLLDALRAGAAGFLLKTIAPEALVHAVCGAVDGVTVLSPNPAHNLAERPTSARERGVTEPPADLRLSEQERAILELLCGGASNAEIASTLFLAESTVKTHVSTVMAKLGVPSRLKAVVRAHEWGLLDQTPRTRP